MIKTRLSNEVIGTKREKERENAGRMRGIPRIVALAAEKPLLKCAPVQSRARGRGKRHAYPSCSCTHVSAATRRPASWAWTQPDPAICPPVSSSSTANARRSFCRSRRTQGYRWAISPTGILANRRCSPRPCLRSTAVAVACRSAGYAFTDAPERCECDARVPVWVRFPLPHSFSSSRSRALLFDHAAVPLASTWRGRESIWRARASSVQKFKLRNSLTWD